MTSIVRSDTLAELAADYAGLVDRLQQADLAGAAHVELVEFWRAVEVQNRRLSAVDHRVVAEVASRGLAADHGCASTVALTRQVLNVSPAEAKARVDAAGRLGPRQLPSGPLLGPEYPVTAAAVAAGEVSARHAGVITRTITTLPYAVQDELGDWLESHLLEHARSVDPATLGRHAHRLSQVLDQDGQYRELGYRDRVRECTFWRRPDGSGGMQVRFTGEAAEFYQVYFDASAGPLKQPDGRPDPRSAGQRRHDALLELVKAAMRAGELPSAGGVTATIVLSMDAESYATGVGTAITGHGYAVPAAVAKRWAGGGVGMEARIIATLLNRSRRVEAYSSIQRLFSEQQRLALTARDKGCTFPGCDRPPGWCQAHVIAYRHAGPTSIDNGTLLCGHHHRTFETIPGWAVNIIDGQPWWTPPRWLDPAQKPIRNTAHDNCGR